MFKCAFKLRYFYLMSFFDFLSKTRSKTSGFITILDKLPLCPFCFCISKGTANFTVGKSNIGSLLIVFRVLTDFSKAVYKIKTFHPGE